MRDAQCATRAAELAARHVAPMLRDGWGRTVGERSASEPASVTTPLDLRADEDVRERLARFDDTIGIWSEEIGRTGSTTAYWLLDPLSATGHYVRGTLWSSTMIALVVDGEVLSGVIHDFVNDRTYAATRGHGATVGAEVLAVSTRDPADGYVALEARDRNPFTDAIERRWTTVTMANYGWQMVAVAGGRFEAFVAVRPPCGPWDFAAGALLTHEAGGIVTDLRGAPWTPQHDATEVVAGCPQLHERIMVLLAEDPDGERSGTGWKVARGHIPE